MDQEKLRILKMIEEGKISAAEGAKLMEALETGAVKNGNGDSQKKETEATQLRIRVSDIETDHVKVNLTIPIGFAHMVKSLIPQSEIEKLEKQGVNLNAIFEMVNTGRIGKLLDVEDQEHHQHVIISVE
ncbi:MAG: hypothetical protein EHM28_07710 [Spirochaetaceae bacterium]|nr:MAG: hypothetical protein EHM28_07710 [Spirochaetaceae bacterium]